MSKDINNYIFKEINRIYPEMVKIRRRIHQYPEPGFKEFKTSAFIKNCLKKIGIKDIKASAGTGVVALIKGKEKGRTILLRADMDALTLKEETGLAFSSRHDGFMHACGHDGHIACLIGAAAVLNGLKDKIKGNIKLVFQPAEETSGGALPMIKEGVLKNPKVSAAFGLHIFPSILSGKISLKKGVSSAFADEVEITLLGKSGHGAYPEHAVDTISLASKVIEALHKIKDKFDNKPYPVVITIGKIKGGTKHNIISDKTELFGTIRTLKEDVRKKVHKVVKDELKKLTKKYNAKFSINLSGGYPTVINDDNMTDFVSKNLKDLLGRNNVQKLAKPMLGGEDFAYFSRKVPSVFIKLGSGIKGKNIQLHNKEFYFDEKILKTGAAIHVKAAWEYLNG
ncbi:MAG: M20 family metallopeptidase [Armatimonadota bacterium]